MLFLEDLQQLEEEYYNDPDVVWSHASPSERRKLAQEVCYLFIEDFEVDFNPSEWENPFTNEDDLCNEFVVAGKVTKKEKRNVVVENDTIHASVFVCYDEGLEVGDVKVFYVWFEESVGEYVGTSNIYVVSWYKGQVQALKEKILQAKKQKVAIMANITPHPSAREYGVLNNLLVRLPAPIKFYGEDRKVRLTGWSDKDKCFIGAFK